MNASAFQPDDYDNIIPLPSTNRPEPTRTERVNKPASRTASRSRYPVHHFRYAGRRWRIFKRSAATDANWYFYFERNRQRHGPWSLGTSTRALAEAEAKLKIDLLNAAREADLRRSLTRPGAPVYSTCGDLFRVVDKLAIRARGRGRTDYVWAVRWVMRRALQLETDSAVDALSLAALNADNARRFFTCILAAANACESPARSNTTKRSALQIFGFARALLAPAAVDSMRTDCGLAVPDFTGFRAASALGYNLLKPSDASEFRVPEDAIVRRTLVEWVKLGRTPGYMDLHETARRNVFIAVGLMLSCGLRKGEVIKARWGWCKVFHGIPHLSELDVAVKNQSGAIQVVPLDPFWTILRRTCERNGWRGQPQDTFLVERPKRPGDHGRLQYSHGGHCDRTYWPFYNVGKWLRQLGWKTQKSNHALRDYAASLVTMRYGLEAACDFCRHGQIATTQAHYNRFRSLAGQVNLNTLKWIRWAK